MNTKLTLRLDDVLIKSAKNHAKSVKRPIELTPIVKSLKGSLKNTDFDEDNYKSYLEDKYL